MEVDVRTQVETKILGLLVSLNSWKGKCTMYTCLSSVKKLKATISLRILFQEYVFTTHCIFIVYVGHFFSDYIRLRTCMIDVQLFDTVT